MRYAFAGDRRISYNILRFMIDKGYKPLALFVSDRTRSSHDQQLIDLTALEEKFVFVGKSFKEPASVEILKELELDYIFGIHFPYIIPRKVLEVPQIGFLNLHPAFLPYNKGWHTPSWAILDGSPFGATLHFMTEALDEGDIVHQKKVEVLQQDTANTLYQKVLKLEEEVFYEAFEDLVTGKPKRFAQKEKGTAHNKKDLQAIQEIDLQQEMKPLDVIDQIRALTTNKKSESAFIKIDGKKIGIRVEMFEIND